MVIYSLQFFQILFFVSIQSFALTPVLDIKMLTRITATAILINLIPLIIAFTIQKREDIDEQLRKQFPNLPKKFFTASQDVNHVDQNEILLDSYHSLSEVDFERAKLLTEKDLAPTIEDESLLYSPDLFEGDIFGPLVSFVFYPFLS